MKKRNYIIFFLIEGKLVEQFVFTKREPWARKLRDLAVEVPPYPVFYYNAIHSFWSQVYFDDPDNLSLWRGRMITGLELAELRRWLPDVQGDSL